ncbi:MAG: hypothetical protein IIC55_06695, partial [Proteobacteria bacterium]|nr:hypothetical protein [Pseudomonadota bacterium]
VRGYYWKEGKGCAVGCCIHGEDHSRYETELGIPIQLAYLQDGLFEAMTNGDSKKFPERFLKAIPVGVDLQPVIHRFLHWLLLDKQNGVIRFAKDEPSIKSAIEMIGELHYRAMLGEVIKSSAWSAAGRAAGRAAGSAAWAQGVRMFRVHDVAETRQALAVAQAIGEA